MKVIILAAGQGQRLRPLTDNCPKCMVEYHGKPIIDYILQVIRECSLENIIVIDGYKKDTLESYLKNENVKFYTNSDFDKTNMVTTLFCAESELNDDVIISYSDIIYKKEVLQKLIDSDADISVIVDQNWQELWSIRMENPLDDAETMKIGVNNTIIELGKKATNYNDIQGQYIGLIKISKKMISKIKDFYSGLDKNAIYDGKDFYNMFMTSFIQMIIERLCPVNAVFINGGWIEIDSTSDLENYLHSQKIFF